MALSRRSAALSLLTLFFISLSAFGLMTAKLHRKARRGRFVHRNTIVHGDGARLYSYLRSAWFDRDLDTANELEHFFNYPGSRERREIAITRTGYAWNHTPVGCAILWSPLFLAGHATALVIADLTDEVKADGYSFPYTLAVALGTHLYCFLGMLLLLSICCRCFPPASSLLAVITVWFASFLPAYLFLYPSMSHALSFFTVCLFLWLWLEIRDGGRWWLWAITGLAAGLMTLVRTQNALFLALPLARLIWRPADEERGRRPAGGVLLLFCFALVGFFPQLYAWRATYGSWITVPQGGGFLHWGRPAVFKVLFSPRHGLFSWTPALLAGVIGYPLFVARDRRLALPLLAVFLAELYINSIVDDWWAGTGFGARRFANCLPIFGLGIAAAAESLRARRLGWVAVCAACALIAWNGLFLAQYALNWVSHMEAIDMGRMARDQARMLLFLIRKIA